MSTKTSHKHAHIASMLIFFIILLKCNNSQIVPISGEHIYLYERASNWLLLESQVLLQYQTSRCNTKLQEFKQTLINDSYQFPWPLLVCLAIHPEGPDILPGKSELWCNPEAGSSSHGQCATLDPPQCSHLRFFPHSCINNVRVLCILCNVLFKQQLETAKIISKNNSTTHSPTPKVILIRPCYLQVQFAVLVWVILSATGVHPLQLTEAGSNELLARCWVVSVDMHTLALQGRTQAELKLKA